MNRVAAFCLPADAKRAYLLFDHVLILPAEDGVVDQTIEMHKDGISVTSSVPGVNTYKHMTHFVQPLLAKAQLTAMRWAIKKYQFDPALGFKEFDKEVIQKDPVYGFVLLTDLVRRFQAQLENHSVVVAQEWFRPDLLLTENSSSSPPSHNHIAEYLLPLVPVVSHENEWDALVDFKKDVKSLRKLRDLHNWINEVESDIAPERLCDNLQQKLEDYRIALRSHGLKSVTGALRGLIATGGLSSWLKLDSIHTALYGVASIALVAASYLNSLEDLRRTQPREIAYLYDLQKKYQ